jgi:hypothetical protein
VKNKQTVACERALADAATKITAVLSADAFEGDAHAFLMGVYKDATQPIELRVVAAKAVTASKNLAMASGELATLETWPG